MVFNIGSIGNIINQGRSILSTVDNIRSIINNPQGAINQVLSGAGGVPTLIGGGLNDLLVGGGGTQVMSGGTSGGSTLGSFAFEHVFASLTPFQFPSGIGASHPLAPIMSTGGIVFPYNPTISEGVSVKYDSIELTHTNESYYAYKGTDNVRINISDAVWTCDTFANAVYALSVLHFFRSYSFMDFGRFKTGRPPSPMWFSAYGNYAFNRVPCLMEKADWSFPNDIDFVGVPEFGSPEYNSQILQTNRNATGNYTWLPVKFTISSISLIVQHSPTYWTNFSLDDYWSGAMLARGGFHNTGPTPGNSNITGQIGS